MQMYNFVIFQQVLNSYSPNNYNLCCSQFLMNIIQFLRKNKMSFATLSQQTPLRSIFLNSPSADGEYENPSALWNFRPLIECDDPIKYVSQFLNLEEKTLPITQLSSSGFMEEVLKVSDESHEKNSDKGHIPEKKKKIQKPQNSPFHNYQKHLNNALKKLIIVPEFDPSEQLYKKAASEIWKQYLTLEIKTKRILHYIFNQNNEHAINDSELNTYGLMGIYQRYGVETFNKAKTFLSKLAIDQIDSENIEGYLKTRKLKKHEGFKEYILQFRQELAQGYLKRRVNMQQMQL